MEHLISEQQQLGKEIERLIINFGKDSADRKTESYLHSKLERLDGLWNTFERGHRGLHIIGPDDSEYFISQYFERVRDGCSKLRVDIKGLITEKFGKLVDKPLIPVEQGTSSGLGASTARRRPDDDANPQASQVTALIRRQHALMNVLKRLLTDIGGRLGSPQSSIFYQVKIDAVNKYLDEIMSLNQAIWSICSTPDEYDYKIDDICDIEEVAQDLIIKLRELLQSVLPSQVNQHSGSSSVKLPRITLPVFDGNYLEWKSFSGLYRKLIHEQQINKTEKMFYLMANLSGEAKRLVQHFPVTDASYNSAWDTLVDRYDNQRMTVTTILNRLLGQPIVQLDSVSGIKALHDVTKECILGLEDLGISTKSWDAFLTHVTTKKLDRSTHALYEQALEHPKQVQGIQELLNFLEARFHSLQTLGRASGQRSQAETRSKSAALVASDSSTCPICKLSHAVYACPKFLKFDIKARNQAVRSHKLCINCLQHGHFLNQCSLGGCRKCNKKHNTLLHEENKGSQVAAHTKKTDDPFVPALIALTSGVEEDCRSNYVFLATAIIHIKDNHDNLIECRALLDSGSQLNFISAELAKQLHLRYTHCNTVITGIGSREHKAQQRLHTTIQSRFNKFAVGLEAVILPKITSAQPAQMIDVKHWRLPSNIKLADPSFNKPGKIDLLIGAEHYSELMSVGQIQIDKSLPTLQNTTFGWVVLGKISKNKATSAFCGMNIEGDTYADIQRIWDLEQVCNPIQTRTQSEQYCEEFFNESTSRDQSGRFIVKLPFSKNPAVLGQSKDIAIRRFLSLERRMMKDEALRSQYTDFMAEYLALNHMEKVEETEVMESHYCIPHHCVLKPNSTTTKLRVVFDASCKSASNISLNDILYKGPAIQEDLFSILTRFRLHKYVFTADIEKMYRQILVDSRDQNYQLIVYRPDSSSKLMFYRLKTLTYGTTPASFLATRCLLNLSETAASVHPLTSKVIARDFYMDDVMTGSNDLTEALQLQSQLKGHLRSAGFNLRKWCSNSPLLLATIPDENIELKLDLDDKDDIGIKTLGITWIPKSDQFSIQTNWSSTKKVTKRSILSDIAHIFDPLGLINPVIVHAKIFLQHLWKLKLDWDAALPEELHTRWMRFRDELPMLNKLRIPRQACVTTAKALLQIHGFSDASEKAYGVAIYLRSTDTSGKTAVRLLCAASKVAPTKSVTLPRLELCAAQMLAKITNRVKQTLELADEQIFYWCDSKIVLSWISAESSSYKTFVANRIASIQRSSVRSHWRYVNTSLNPADLVSRGMTPSKLMQSDLWLSGPEFLMKSPFEWPSEEAIMECDQPELRQRISLLTVHHESHFVDTIDHRNSFKHLLRVVAYIYRFTRNLRNSRLLSEPLAIEEINEALFIIVRHIQAQSFAEELKELTKGNQLGRNNSIISLTPFIDDNKVIRVGGRLQAASISYDAKHPMLLPKNHPLVQLLVADMHKNNCHAGPQALLAIVRQRFWPLQGKLLVRSVVQKCVRCFKAKPMLSSQLMGNLPGPRIQQSRPFLHSGVDFCGPIWIHFKVRGKRPQKAYIAVFVCFATKAVHLEVVSDLSSSSFLGALKRFFARRGSSRSIYCDNATNFLGAYNQLEEVKKMLQTKEFQGELTSLCLSRGTDFHFIPPRSPHFGGLWEAAVKSAKQLLYKTIHPVSLTYEELETAIIEIEAILNSRPLTPLSADPNDLAVLTPGHFLIGEALTSAPEVSISTDRPNLLTRWRLVQYVKTEFWKRWTKEYLCELQRRTKWTHSSPNISPGTLVLIKEDNLPPLKWHMGRVITAIEGEDKLVRVADVKTAGGIYRRPIHRLCPLPMDPHNNSLNITNEENKPVRSGTTEKHCSSTLPSDSAPKKRRRRGGSLNTINLMLFVLTFPVLSKAIQLFPFQSPPGLYFENIGRTNIISDEWKIIVYYNMRSYWQEGKDLATEITNLGLLCKRPESDNYCTAISDQLQQKFKQIQELNSLLISSDQKIRKRRAPLEIIGSISNSLFGLLDQDYAKELVRKIKAMQDNNNHLKDMMASQTLIIESTANIFKKSEENIKEQFSHLNLAIDALWNKVVSDELKHLTTSSSVHLSLILQNYQDIQSTLLDVLTNIHHGRISPLLITPEQLESGMHKIRPHLPLARRLPEYENHIDLLQLFRLMTLQGRATEEYIIAEIKIPLLANERFDTLQVIPVPMYINNTNFHIAQTTEILVINPHRDQYLPITHSEFNKCTQLFNGEYFCRQAHPIYHKGSNQSRCEINLLNHEDFSTSGCRSIVTDDLRRWTPLHSPNNWIYSVNSKTTVNIVCNARLTQTVLVNSGIIVLDSNCIIKDDHLTISSRNTVTTRLNSTAITVSSHNFNFSTSIFTSPEKDRTKFQSEGKAIAALQKQITRLKLNEATPLEDPIQEIHQFSIAYVALILLIALMGYLGWTRCRTKTIAPIPAPRATIETNEGDDNIENVDEKDLLRPDSTSPSESSVNSLENTNIGQIISPALVAATASTASGNDEPQQPLSASPLHVIPTTLSSKSVSSLSSSSVPSSVSNSSCTGRATTPIVTSSSSSVLTSSSYVAPLSATVAELQAVQLQQLKQKTILPPSASSSSTLAIEPTPSSSSSATSIASNLIDSHDDVEHSATVALIQQYPSAERELASPRCQSRDSSSGGRCPSDDSNYSGHGSTTAPTATSPVGITLPATLPPGAAAALLPPQSAAMAAYLNVAAAAAQQNRLLMGNPLAAGLVRAAQSPPTLPLSSPVPDDGNGSILDFSTKRMRRDSDTDSKSDSDAVNLSKSDNGPLDLSVGSRKRNADGDAPPAMRKVSRQTEYKPVVSPWTSPITPYFAAAVAAASLSPKNPLPAEWNGKNKMVTNDATKALEKMSEMTRLGGSDNDMGGRPPSNHSNSGGGRHSAWQSHWLNKGADAVKDVFKCVWCKQSFPTLATLTTHMKETQHCGVNVPPSSNMSSSSGNQQSHHHHHHQSASSTSSNTSSNKSDLNLLIKETMPLPRKLVRGQDVWLGKGAEQTRQILKCMWCGQSFRSLAEMTSHMQQTQHYTNIISQEQIISWKSSEDGKGGGSGSSNSGGAPSNANSGANSTVSAVLTCKVCDQAFSSLKDLSNHMVKNAHYKEHIMRSITESGGRRRQTREKRKKSLPVRKLLELERAQHDFKNGEVKPMRDMGSTRITCEKCGDKIETALFVEHIRQCVGGSIPNSPRGMMKNSLSANSIIPPDSMSPLTPNSRDGRKSIGDESASPASNRHISPHAPDLSSPSPKESTGGGSGEKMSSPSVLNAIEQLIEKSFDTRSRHGNTSFTTNSHTSAPLGSSILKRLGIDESVDYTKPLIDPQTMNLLRSYQQQHYPKRERSGSESSSVSDRGSSRLESLTPERKLDLSNHVTPRQSPEKSCLHSENDEDHRDMVKVKNEPMDDDDSETEADGADKVQVKKEPNDEKDNDTEIDLSSKRKASSPSSLAPSPNHAAHGPSSVVTSTPVPSPGSDRSITPRSSSNSEKKHPSGSLNALSSMFDNLTGSNSASANSNDQNSGHASGSKKGSSHPLAALQKLCDKTETTTQNSRSNSSGTLLSNIPTTGGTASGAILAFSWACNDAVMTSDSIIKCAFCDTPFCSKGAYRHHLSKVHFVKDDVIIDPIAINKSSSGSSSIGGGPNGAGNSGAGQKSNLAAPSTSQSPKSAIAGGSSNNGGNNKNSPSPSSTTTQSSASGGQQSVPPTSSSSSSFEESPHSKFLKYTELAKQLSSKYV